ncbi:hypothetical protein [Gimesia aquarii]|uniref:hypothetical protein n=1 Tax=Gimesia aquarii TaxID=2527964 RepID=UPI001E3F4E93|nr:hypothetical protein [Gimesia aquarii]
MSLQLKSSNNVSYSVVPTMPPNSMMLEQAMPGMRMKIPRLERLWEQSLPLIRTGIPLRSR